MPAGHNRPSMQRRDLLAGLGRRAAALALGALFNAPRGTRATERLPPTGEDPFTLGVASGMPAADRVVLWTRLAPRPREPLGGLPDAPVALHWELAEDEAFSRGLRHGTLTVHPEHAHSAHVEVEGLSSDRRYVYRFRAGDALSPIGRTRTAPAPDSDVSRLRCALASCQHYEHGEYALHREIAARDLDFVLFVGDYIYESTNPRYRRRPHEGPVPTTLDGYRQRHVTYKLDPALRAAHAAHPWILTWDDHEVENDYAGDASRRREFDRSAFLKLRAAAYKAYFEHMPVSPGMAPRGPDMRIHAHYGWGRLADLWTLDNRQYRSIQPCNPAGRAGGRVLTYCSSDNEVATMFGANQEAWIATELANRTARWRLLAQGSQISPSGIDTPLGRSRLSDGWDGYPNARARLLRAIAAQPRGDVVCLGGDVHRHVAARLRLDPADTRSPVVASEFVTNSLTSRGLSDTALDLIRRSNPDMLYLRGHDRGYMLLELTPKRLRCEMRSTAFPVVADARIVTHASYVVEHGVPGPQRDSSPG